MFGLYTYYKNAMATVSFLSQPRNAVMVLPLEKATTASFEICALLGCYAASSGNYLPTFWDNVSVPSSKVKRSLGTLSS
jgi:hypothetical protein